MKLYSLYDRSKKPILERVTIDKIAAALPAGAVLIEGAKYDKEGLLKESRGIYKAAGRLYEVVEVQE